MCECECLSLWVYVPLFHSQRICVCTRRKQFLYWFVISFFFPFWHWFFVRFSCSSIRSPVRSFIRLSSLFPLSRARSASSAHSFIRSCTFFHRAQIRLVEFHYLKPTNDLPSIVYRMLCVCVCIEQFFSVALILLVTLCYVLHFNLLILYLSFLLEYFQISFVVVVGRLLLPSLIFWSAESAEKIGFLSDPLR